MKVFAVLLVSIALCSAASTKAGKTEKTVSKRGLFELCYGYAQEAPIAYAAQAYNSAPLVAPVAAPPFIPSPQLIPQTETLLPQVHAEPIQAQALPVPQVRTIVKHVHVPYERVIKVDNPVYQTIERQVPIDNPVPVVRIVKQPVPIHVDEPVPFAVVKEVRVPEPYLHKVRVVLQQVFVKNHEKPIEMGYLPPAEPQKDYLPPQNVAPAAQKSAPLSPPSTSYGAPFNAPAEPSPSYGTPFSAPAPPSPLYGAPQHQQQPQQHFAPQQQQHFDTPAQNYIPPAQQYSAAEPQGYH